MSRLAAVLMAVAVAAVAGGCGQELAPGKTRILGEMPTADAFAAARGVMSQHFIVASANEDTGVITAEPVVMEGPSGRVLGGTSQDRKLVSMKIYRQGKLTMARLTIALQRQSESMARATIDTNEPYSAVPNQTPAQGTGATTPEQNSLWQTLRYDTGQEAAILEELYQALQPAAATQPVARD